MLGVYQIRVTGTEYFYYGSAENCVKRKHGHLRALRKGTHHSVFMQRVFNKYGEDRFQFVLKKKTRTRAAAFKHEQQLLDEFVGTKGCMNVGADAKGGDNLSNNPNKKKIVAKMTKSMQAYVASLTDAARKARFGQHGSDNGMHGRSHSKESRRKMSLKKKGVKLGPRENWSMSDQQRSQLAELGRQRSGEKNGFYGRTHSAETKAKIAAQKIGTLPSNTRKVKIGRKTYPSATEAGRQLGVVTATILYRIKSVNYPDYSYKD